MDVGAGGEGFAAAISDDDAAVGEAAFGEDAARGDISLAYGE